MSLLGPLIAAMGFPLRSLSQKKMARAIGRWYCPYFRIDRSVSCLRKCQTFFPGFRDGKGQLEIFEKRRMGIRSVQLRLASDKFAADARASPSDCGYACHAPVKAKYLYALRDHGEVLSVGTGPYRLAKAPPLTNSDVH